MTSTMTPAGRNGTEEQTVIGRATTVVTDVGAQVQTAATDAAAALAKHAPAATAASRSALDRALATLRRSSTVSLAMGTVFASGMTGGMLLSRAPRALVSLAFLPALLLGGTVLGRATTRPEGPAREART
jgi:hypothetical protein